jgi:hypothetical protein
VTFEQLKSAFANKRVLLTGQTGFKGAWLTVLLHDLGAQTLGYALPPETTPAMFDLTGGAKLCEHVIGDLRDRPMLDRVVQKHRPDVVLHLAAQSLVRRSYRDPIDTFESNILGTANVLDAVREYDGPCAVVVITTDKVYAEKGEPTYAYRESDPLGGYDPYSSSKAACEIVTESYRKSYFHPRDYAKHGKALATARAGNVIGGGGLVRGPAHSRRRPRDEQGRIGAPAEPQVHAPVATRAGTTRGLPDACREAPRTPDRLRRCLQLRPRRSRCAAGGDRRATRAQGVGWRKVPHRRRSECPPRSRVSPH